MSDGRRTAGIEMGAAAALLASNVGSGKSLALEPAKRPESQDGVRGRPVFDKRWKGNKVLRSLRSWVLRSSLWPLHAALLCLFP